MFHSETFKNILYIIEICVVVAWAQGTVENGFILVRRLMPEYRSRLSNEMLDDLLLLKLNMPILEEIYPEDEYENSVLKRAVEKYLKSAKWRWVLKPSSRSAQSSCHDQSPATKRRAEEMIVFDSDSDLDSDEETSDFSDEEGDGIQTTCA